MGSLALRSAGLLLVVALTGACGDDDAVPSADATTLPDEPVPEVSDDSGDPGDGAGEGIGEACALVTEDDAVRILGEDVTGEESDLGDDPVMSAECVWTNVAEDHGAQLQFRVFTQSVLYQEEIYAGEVGFEEVAGLGNDAYAVSSDTVVTLNVLVGEQVLQFDASKGGGDFDPDTALEELIELAERVLSETALV